MDPSLFVLLISIALIVWATWGRRETPWVVREVVMAVPLPVGRISVVAIARDWKSEPQRGVFVQIAPSGTLGQVEGDLTRPLTDLQIATAIDALDDARALRVPIGDGATIRFDEDRRHFQLLLNHHPLHDRAEWCEVDDATIDRLRTAFQRLAAADIRSAMAA